MSTLPRRLDQVRQHLACRAGSLSASSTGQRCAERRGKVGAGLSAGWRAEATRVLPTSAEPRIGRTLTTNR